MRLKLLSHFQQDLKIHQVHQAKKPYFPSSQTSFTKNQYGNPHGKLEAIANSSLLTPANKGSHYNKHTLYCNHERTDIN
jgi:hypothetical protein